MKTLSQYLAGYGLKAEDGVCLTLGTDHFKPEKGNLLSVSASAADRQFTVYVKGGQPEKTQQYTGLLPFDYYKLAEPEEKVVQFLNKEFSRYRFFVVYNRQFIQSWLATLDGLQYDKPVLDVTEVAKLRELQETEVHGSFDVPEALTSLQELVDRMEMATVARGKKPAFTELVEDHLAGETFGRPTPLLQKPAQLFHLYCAMLEMPL